MKKRRLFLVMSIMLVLVMLFIFSSSVFELSSVEIKFYSDIGEPLSLSSNRVFNSTQKTKVVIDSAKFDYGSLVFSLDKPKYITRIESANPYIKVLSLESIFPSKLVINACERKELFYILGTDRSLILDSDFKILDMRKDATLLTQMTFFDYDREVSFYDFFDVSPLAFEKGMFLTENNLVLSSINSLMPTLYNFDLDILGSISTFSFAKRENNKVDLSLATSSPFGLTLKICNIFENFDYKLNKLLSAFYTLYQKERIKTTHGLLSIDESFNCRWQE